MEEKAVSDTDAMQESLEERRNRIASLMRAERQALERLKDILHKYRVVLPYMSGRVKSLDERLALLMANRDEAQAALAGLRTRMALLDRQLEQGKSDVDAGEKLLAALTGRANALMQGKFPADFPPAAAGASFAERKRDFMARMAAELDETEIKTARTAAETAALKGRHQKLSARRKKLLKRMTLLETKIGIYQNEIRDVLLDVNNQSRNEAAVMEEVQSLVARIKAVPALSEWADKVFREAVKATLPAGRIIELSRPITVRRLSQ